jgi:hypothetical protein
MELYNRTSFPYARRGMETPPNYSQYPRPDQSGGFGTSGRGYRGPGIYFDYINEAWDMVRKNMAVYVVGALLVIINAAMYGSPMGPKPGEMPHFNPSMIPLSLIAFLIPMSISQVLNTGISLCALEEADTGATSINTLFSGFRYFINVAATCLLYILAIYVGLVLCIIPAFYVAGLFAFAPIIAAREGLGPIQSMQRSSEMLKPFAWANFGFMFVASFINILGVIACCVGLLWTTPILYIGLALHYRDFRGAAQGYVAPSMAP